MGQGMKALRLFSSLLALMVFVTSGSAQRDFVVGEPTIAALSAFEAEISAYRLIDYLSGIQSEHCKDGVLTVAHRDADWTVCLFNDVYEGREILQVNVEGALLENKYVIVMRDGAILQLERGDILSSLFVWRIIPGEGDYEVLIVANYKDETKFNSIRFLIS